MGSTIIFMILLQVVLILLNAVFACAEIAVISMNDNKMEKMAEEGNKRAKRLVKLTSQPARFLATIQVAISGQCFCSRELFRCAGKRYSRTGNCYSGSGFRVCFRYFNYHCVVLFHTCIWRTCSKADCHAKSRALCSWNFSFD